MSLQARRYSTPLRGRPSEYGDGSGVSQKSRAFPIGPELRKQFKAREMADPVTLPGKTPVERLAAYHAILRERGHEIDVVRPMEPPPAETPQQEDVPTRRCRACNRYHPPDDFRVASRDGRLSPVCLTCEREAKALQRECTACRRSFPETAYHFYLKATGKPSFRPKCKSCDSRAANARREAREARAGKARKVKTAPVDLKVTRAKFRESELGRLTDKISGLRYRLQRSPNPATRLSHAARIDELIAERAALKGAMT